MKNSEMVKVAAFASEMKRGMGMVKLLVSLAITDILSQRRRGGCNREPQGGALTRNKGGFSLAELLVVLSIVGVIASALVTPIYQIFAVTGQGNSELGVQHDLQTAATWLNRDVLTASGAKIDSPEDGVYRLTLEVPYLSTKGEGTTTISYTYSEETGDLTRDSGDSLLTVARHISANPFPPPGAVIDAPDSVTVTLRSREGSIFGEGSFALKMRAHKSGGSRSGDE